MMAQSGHRNAEKDALLKEKRSSETKTQNSETRNAKRAFLVSEFRWPICATIILVQRFLVLHFSRFRSISF